MIDFKTQQGLATQECAQCGNEFTKENPCCCDGGLFESPEGDCHVDGVCMMCHAGVHINHSIFNAGHERGE